MSMKNIKIYITVLVISLNVTSSFAQLAACKGKFLGNIMPNTWQYGGVPVVRSDWGSLWNQVSPENAGKWGVAESSRDNFNWTDLDVMYDYCQTNNIPFKQHVFVWGSQQPSWIAGLSQQDQRDEVEEWYSAFAQRYPNTAMIDVVNESIRNHAPAVDFADALGGKNNGASISYLANHPTISQYGYGTGWDYIIYAFAKARDYFPNSELILNDYGIINDPSAITEHLAIVNILKTRGLIDAVGFQGHGFNIETMSAANLKSNLDQLASAGLPIYCTELDIRGSSEQQQKDRFATVFPALWEHPNVKGITLWGYVMNQTWESDPARGHSGIMNEDGTDRMALTWLRQYMAAQPDVCTASGNPTIKITSPLNNASFEDPATITITADASDSDGSIASVSFYNGNTLLGTDDSAPYSYTWENVSGGSYSIKAIATDNEDNTTTSTIIKVNVLGNIVVRASGTDGTEILELEIDGQVVETWTLGVGMALYAYSGPSTGVFHLNYTNDADGRDVQVDYLEIDGVKYEAEDQQLNTGSYANNACGGGEYTEYMYCSGYIEFEIQEVCSTPTDIQFSVLSPIELCVGEDLYNSFTVNTPDVAQNGQYYFKVFHGVTEIQGWMGIGTNRNSVGSYILNNLIIDNSGVYTIRVQDGNTDNSICYLENQFDLVVKDFPFADAGDDILECTFDNTATTLLQGNVPMIGENSTWSGDNGNIISPSFRETEVTNIPFGENTFVYTLNNGICPEVSDSIIVFVDVCTGTSDLNHKSISLYPNPVTGNTIHFDSVLHQISILNSLGEVMLNSQDANFIDVSRLNKGLYLLKSEEGVFRFEVLQ